jgi:hypothetical protein
MCAVAVAVIIALHGFMCAVAVAVAVAVIIALHARVCLELCVLLLVRVIPEEEEA